MTDNNRVLLEHIQGAFTNKNWSELQTLLPQAMISLDGSQAVYEIGAFTSVALKNQSSLDRYMSLLFPIYFDQNAKLTTESQPYVLLGLHLLSLLVRNQVAEFHVILEQIKIAPALDATSPFILFPVQLQQCLVEGTYHRVVLAKEQAPSPDYAWFVGLLIDTIRNELADCLEKSFESIDVPSAARLLLLTQDQIPQLVTFAQQRGWNLQNNNATIVFADANAKITDLDTFTRNIIVQSLEYARELEQII